MRLCRSIAYASAAIAIIRLCWHISTGATEPTPLFNSDPRHVSNRLYRQLHGRTERDGKQDGFDSLDPLFWSETNYPLTGKSHARAFGLLNEFTQTHAERHVTDPVRRAILQRDLWAVFYWADELDLQELPHPAERRELMAALAPIVNRLALSPEELAHLPDTYASALENHEFPAAYNPAPPPRFPSPGSL
jgi:hypothetical protein